MSNGKKGPIGIPARELARRLDVLWLAMQQLTVGLSEVAETLVAALRVAAGLLDLGASGPPVRLVIEPMLAALPAGPLTRERLQELRAALLGYPAPGLDHDCRRFADWLNWMAQALESLASKSTRPPAPTEAPTLELDGQAATLTELLDGRGRVPVSEVVVWLWPEEEATRKIYGRLRKLVCVVRKAIRRQVPGLVLRWHAAKGEHEAALELVQK